MKTKDEARDKECMDKGYKAGAGAGDGRKFEMRGIRADDSWN